MAKTTIDCGSIVFKKENILQMQRYRDRTDLLNVLLKNNGKYTIDEVDTMVKKFMEVD